MVMALRGGMICAWLSRPTSTPSTPTLCASLLIAQDRELDLAPDQDRPAHPRTLAAQTLALRGQDRAPAGGAGPAVRGDGGGRPRGDDRGAGSALRQPASAKGQAKRKPLPPELPRTEIHHEPDSTTCACGCQMKRIGEDVAEKLDYTPGTFSVQRHIRGKWACAQLRNPGAGPGARPRDRQGHPHHRAPGPGAGGQVPGSSAAVPPGRHLRPGGARDSPIHARPVGRPDGRSAASRWSMP